MNSTAARESAEPQTLLETNAVNKRQKPRYFLTKTGLYTTLHQTHTAKKANCERGTSGPIIKASRMPGSG